MAGLFSLEFLCSNLRKTEKLFVEKLGLSVIGRGGDSVALQKNQILLALKPATCEKDREILEKSGTLCNNLVFRVPELQAAYEKASRAGARVVKKPATQSDSFGSIKSCVIQSPFTNVTHTLVDPVNYNGVYLPGYAPCNTSRTSSETFSTAGISFIDHITYACNIGDSENVIRWYEKCLGFVQFQLGIDDNEMTVDCDGGGLKLQAMEYWLCAERGVKSGTEDGIKLVMVESLPNSRKNQVSTFLESNGGPGVQHIAFHTNDIISTTAKLRKHGLSMIQPPVEYYTLPIASAIDELGYNKQLLLENGILFDAEFDDTANNNRRHLMQVFTQPLFKKDSFFIELIQRCGAKGFGAGNITALFHALELHLKMSSSLSVQQ